MSDPAGHYLQPLSWHQTAIRPETYELRAITGPITTLTFQSKHQAIAQSAGVSWLFLIRGLFRRVADIRHLPNQKLLGTCRLGYWSSAGILSLRPGLSLSFSSSSWDKTYRVRTEGGASVLTYDFRGFFSLRSPMLWGESPEAAEQVPWLVPFAWFLAVRHYRDIIEAAGAAVITG